MTDRERQIYDQIGKAMPVMNDEQKGQLAAFLEGVAMAADLLKNRKE